MKWSTQADTRRSSLTKAFGNNLRQIANSLANQQRATEVAPNHVDRAYETIAAHGFGYSQWRPTATIAVGTFLIGISGNIPSWVAAIAGRPNQAFANGGLLLALLGGVILLAVGWRQQQSPAAPQSVPMWRSVLAWVGIVLLLCIMLGVSIANIVSQQAAASSLAQQAGSQPAANSTTAVGKATKPVIPAPQRNVPTQAPKKP